MKFISFIASTVLIVLIGQHSIMGAPTARKTKGESCPEGYEIINGQCMLINSMASSTETEDFSSPAETVTIYTEQPVIQKHTVIRYGGCSKGMKQGKNGLCEPIQSYTETEVIKKSRAAQILPETVTVVLIEEKPVTNEPKKIGGCPKGMTQGEHGICEPIQPSTTTQEINTLATAPSSPETVTVILNEPKPVLKKLQRDGSCPKGMQHGEHGICEPIQPSTTTQEIDTSTTASSSPETVTVILIEPKPVLKELQRYGSCPEGMQHGEHGICEPIESSSTTESTDKSTTEPNENVVGGVDIPQGCPNGTQPDEEGYCQPIQPTNSTKLGTDPKNLLKKDGSCPDNYKMIGSQCLYIKPETNSTVYLGASTADDMTGKMKPKSGSDGSSDIELVPVLSDNSCPAGTVYSSYGLCQKRARPTNANLLMKSDGSCPDDFELVNGKCTYKTPKIPGQSGFPTKANQIKQTTKFPQVSSHSDESFESTTTFGQ